MKKFKPISILVSAILMLIIILPTGCNKTSLASATESQSPVIEEVEATEFQGEKLTPLSKQGNNALA